MKSKLTIEAWPVERLVPSLVNAKAHDEDQITRLARAINEHGWDQPIVVDKDGEIIKGHGRRLAALKLGLKEVPVLVRNDLTKAQARAARLSDNAVVSTNYDTELLKKELAELSLDTTIDLTAIGFTNKELEFLTVDLGNLNVDAFAPDVNTAVDTQRKANDAKIAEVDKGEIALNDAFGFKKVTLDLSRRIRAFVASLEDETGKKGSDAFAEFLMKAGY